MNSASGEEAVKILDLNDDCLLEVFKYLNLLELNESAAVCKRFRQNARECFARSKKNDLDLFVDIHRAGDTLDRVITKAWSVLRNFGEFITRVKVDNGNRTDYPYLKAMCSPAIIELLVRYCHTVNATHGKALRDLELFAFDFQDDFAHTMGPLIERLHTLTLRCCNIEGMFLSLWPVWATELRELRLIGINVTWKRFDCLHQRFPKLVKIVLHYIYDLNISDIAKMLKFNPQLKEIELNDCCSLPFVGNTFVLIAEYVPEVETLNLISNRLHKNRECIQHFAKLSKLKSLTLRIGSTDALSVIGTIAPANISLKYLCIWELDFLTRADRVIDVISKFKRLETLKLQQVMGLSTPHLIEICKHCCELSTIHTFGDFLPTPDNILEIVRSLTKLRSLHIRPWNVSAYNQYCVDVDEYTELLEIVRPRCWKLEIQLNDFHYNTSVPVDFARAHRESLLITWTKKEWFDDIRYRHY